MTGVRAPHEDLSPATVNGLRDALLDVLRQDGPQELPQLQIKLSVASHARFKDLIQRQVRDGVIERVYHNVRLKGDLREVPANFKTAAQVGAWTKRQIEIMRKGYPTLSREQLLARLPGFSWPQIAARATLLRLSRANFSGLIRGQKKNG